MDQNEQDFFEELYQFLEQLQKGYKDPKVASDLSYLERFAKSIQKLETLAASLTNATDEMVKFDAQVVYNTLHAPVFTDKRSCAMIPILTANAFLEKKEPHSDLEKMLVHSFRYRERIAEIIGDLVEIFIEYKSVKKGRKSA